MDKDILLTVLTVLVLLLVVLLVSALTRGSRRARARVRRARTGEGDAEKLLQNHGYAVEDNQCRGEVVVKVDGQIRQFEVRADFLVWRQGRRFVAEVKTGDKVIELSHGSTRRQLLEYRRAFDVDGVLLVLPERGLIHHVDFPEQAQPSPWRLVGWGFLSGAITSLVVILWLR